MDTTPLNPAPTPMVTQLSSGQRIMNEQELHSRIARIETLLEALLERQMVKDYYTTYEFAQLVSKSEFTIREHCRHGRIRAEKKQSGRGAHPAWVIAHAELLRFQREGLLPLQRPS